MHIQVITPRYNPEICATAYLYHELCRSFISMGHKVTVVTGYPVSSMKKIPLKYRSSIWMTENIDGVKVLRIKTMPLPGQLPAARGIEASGLAAALFLRALSWKRPDVMLVHPPILFEGLAAIAIRSLRKIPFILNIHDLFPQTAIDLGLLRNKALIAGFRQLETYLYRKADWITTHSPANRRWVISRGGNASKNSVFPIWMDSKKLSPGPSTNTWRKQQGLENRFTVVFAGTQGYNQDIGVILRTAQRLINCHNIHFIIIGDGSQHNSMLRKSNGMNLCNITWLGWQPRDQYPLIMHTADAVVATLKKEVSTPVVPSKILSAMSAGRPIIACMPFKGDAPKLIRRVQAGIVLPPGNDMALAAAITRLCKNHDFAEQLGTNGRKYVEQYLDVHIWAKKYEDLFLELIQNFKKHRKGGS